MIGFFSGFFKRFGFNGFAESFFIEDDQDAYAGRYGHVGDVEDGVEEFKMAATDHRNPSGPIALENREIEHVYDFAVKDGPVRFL